MTTLLGEIMKPFEGNDPEFALGENAIYFSNHRREKTTIFLRNLTNDQSIEPAEVERRVPRVGLEAWLGNMFG